MKNGMRFIINQPNKAQGIFNAIGATQGEDPYISKTLFVNDEEETVGIVNVAVNGIEQPYIPTMLEAVIKKVNNPTQNKGGKKPEVKSNTVEEAYIPTTLSDCFKKEAS